MVARARERFAPEHRCGPEARKTGGALPNLVIIGGLKCGRTSLHHYLGLHPEIGMSKPKELNFFVSELNWPLGRGLVRKSLPGCRPGARRDLPALHK